MTKQFNVIDEPWLAVRAPDGSLVHVGLREVLLKAHHFVGLVEANPPNLVALHRLLLAMLNRALVRDGVAWEPRKWWIQGLQEKPILNYLEQWHDRFWVFHEEHPFMQVAALGKAPETHDRQKPWTNLALDRASGNTPLLFDHTQDDAPPVVETGLALRNLIGFMQSTPGGLVRTLRDSDNAGPLGNTAAVLPLGGTLCQTLLLCLHRTRFENDLPAWEQSAPSIAQLKGRPSPVTGLNDRFTRRTRAVLLIPADEAGTVVQHVRFAAGLAMEDAPQVPEPMAAYRPGTKGPIRLTISEGRALWRDLPALIPDSGIEQQLHPRILDTAAQMLGQADSGIAHIPVLIAGLASYQAKRERWRTATVTLPKVMLEGSEPTQALRAMVAEAEATGDSLRKIAWELTMKAFPSAAKGGGMARALPMLPVFFAKMEQAAPELVRMLGQGEPEGAMTMWKGAQAEAAMAAWAATGSALGASLQAIKATAQVRGKYDALVRRLLKESQGNTAEEGKA